MYWVHLLYVEALLVGAYACIRRFPQFRFNIVFQLRVRYWHLNTRIFQTDATARLKTI